MQRLALVLLVAIATAGCSSNSHLPSVPNVVGRPLAEACSTLENAGYDVKLADGDCTAQAAVTGQAPDGGTEAGPGAIVTLMAFPTKSVPSNNSG